ncbi:transposase [Kineococcus sp. TRM81007]|uniref:transposase n=1 Tax=Kineococcus sp. TRM81007 TaxID=2925831 RepID=UPI0035A9156B
MGDAGDVARFPTSTHVESWNGTAPIGASSGDDDRRRLPRPVRRARPHGAGAGRRSWPGTRGRSRRAPACCCTARCARRGCPSRRCSSEGGEAVR